MVWKRPLGREGPTPPSRGPADSAPPPVDTGPERPPARPARERPASGSRRVRVFVSSTFRDMAAERDELMSQAWPELRRLCRERQVEFVEVDLRWGISEEQSSRKETLKLCLDEIQRCRPYFIGLLGERYGWVPGGEAFTADLEEEQPWVRELRGRSVTELEILYGVLNDPDMAGRAFFYLRDPAYVDSLPGEERPWHCEPTPAEIEEHGAAEAERLAAEKRRQLGALKERIRAACREKGIPLRENYPDPRALAEMVQADLQAAIDAEYPAESVPDPLEREAREHEFFAEYRRRVYIGRPGYDEALDRHALGRGGPIAVLGESGGGKSALLANWLHGRCEDHPGDFFFQHYIGATPGSASHWGLLGRLLGEIKRWTGETADLPASHDDTLRDLPLWLARLRATAERRGARAVVVLDALNQLEEGDGGRRLGWLPGASFTGSLRLVVSALPGEALDAIERQGWPVLRVEPLTAGERREMIAAYLARFSKRLDERRVSRLAGAPAAANPLYLKLLLDELRVTGTHERLDERLEGYLAAGSIPALLDRIMARWEEAYQRDRPGLVGEALSLIWAARRGLSEPELLALLRPAGLPQLPPALWAPLRAALDESLVDRGGILGFAHEFLRSAVERRYASGEDRQRGLRLRLAGYFEGQPATARACDEQPWLLWQAGERVRLRTCLLDMDRFCEVRKRDQQELLGYWLCLDEVEGMGARYGAAFEAWERGAGSGAAPARVSRVANELGFFLHYAGQYGHARAAYERALAVWRKTYGEDHPDVAAAHNNLGGVLQALGDLPAARAAYERALAIWRKAYGEDDPDVATAHNNLGGVLKDLGDLPAARAAHERALAIGEKTLGPDHPTVAIRLNNLGMVLQDLGDLPAARAAFKRALAIHERAYGPDHPDVATNVNNLGSVLYALGDLPAARAAFERVLGILAKTLPPEHLNAAATHNNLGDVLQELGDLPAARAAYERALAIHERAYGPDHPDVATDVNNLGGVLQAMEDLPAARAAYERALAISEKTLGPDHPTVAIRLNNLGWVLQDLDDLPAARAAYERALAIGEKTLGPDHPDVAIQVNNLGEVLRALGDYPAARAAFERTLAISEKTLGPDHPNVATGVNNLGLALQALGDLPAARAAFERALAIWYKTHSEDHPEVAVGHNNLGAVLQDLGDLPAARAAFKRALAIFQATLPPHHPYIRTIRRRLALLSLQEAPPPDTDEQ